MNIVIVRPLARFGATYRFTSLPAALRYIADALGGDGVLRINTRRYTVVDNTILPAVSRPAPPVPAGP